VFISRSNASCLWGAVAMWLGTQLQSPLFPTYNHHSQAMDVAVFQAKLVQNLQLLWPSWYPVPPPKCKNLTIERARGSNFEDGEQLQALNALFVLQQVCKISCNNRLPKSHL
jgi:hypothetical protein